MRKLAVVILLLGAACSAKSTTSPPPVVATPTHTKAPVVVKKKPAFAVTTFSAPTTFTTEDGNLGCDVESAYARCDTVHHDWALPPQPADCTSGFGHGIEMQLGTMASFFCGSDSVLGSKRILAKGHAIKVGFVECDAVSATTVTCKSFSDAHGFTVSRASYHLS